MKRILLLSFLFLSCANPTQPEVKEEEEIVFDFPELPPINIPSFDPVDLPVIEFPDELPAE